MAGGATFGGAIVGTLNWDGGSLYGVMTLASNSVFNIVAGGGDGLNGLVLTNYGTVNWTNTPLYGISGNNAQIYNYGLWNAQSDNTFTGGYNGGTSLFDNFGTFLKSGNAGVTTLDSGVVFNNTGTLNSQVGNIALQGPYTLANGTKMNFGLGGPAGNGQFRFPARRHLPAASTPTSTTSSGRSWAIPSLCSATPPKPACSLPTSPSRLLSTWQTNYSLTVFTLSVVARSTNPAPRHPLLFRADSHQPSP